MIKPRTLCKPGKHLSTEPYPDGEWSILTQGKSPLSSSISSLSCNYLFLDLKLRLQSSILKAASLRNPRFQSQQKRSVSTRAFSFRTHGSASLEWLFNSLLPSLVPQCGWRKCLSLTRLLSPSLWDRQLDTASVTGTDAPHSPYSLHMCSMSLFSPLWPPGGHLCLTNSPRNLVS